MNVRFATDAAQRYIAWRLDKSSWVLEDSTGYWRVVDVADRPGYVRVYFCVAESDGETVPVRSQDKTVELVESQPIQLTKKSPDESWLIAGKQKGPFSIGVDVLGGLPGEAPEFIWLHDGEELVFCEEGVQHPAAVARVDVAGRGEESRRRGARRSTGAFPRPRRAARALPRALTPSFAQRASQKWQQFLRRRL